MYLTGERRAYFCELDWFKANLDTYFPYSDHALVTDSNRLVFSTQHWFIEHKAALIESLPAPDNSAPIQLQIDGNVLWLLPCSKHCKHVAFLAILDHKARWQPDSIQVHYQQLLIDFAQSHLVALQGRLEKAETWIREEMEEIANIQQLMLPHDNIDIPGTKIAFVYKAMKGAGGDYIDIANLTDPDTGMKEVGIIIADVSGHGPSAAVETAMIDAILRTYDPIEPSPADVLAYINRHFFTRKGRGTFCTAAVFHYSEAEQQITYANAGHPHAYIKSQLGLTSLNEGGIPIGVLREQTWENHTVPVNVGDTLFLYTDVVIETQNTDAEAFGFHGLEAGLMVSPASPDAMLEFLETRMNQFCGCTTFQDDLTMCAIQFLE